MEKYSVVMFTGIDRCGKTTIRKRFAEATNQKYITFDRSFLDNFVYDEVFRKGPLLDEFYWNVSKFKRIDPVIIFLDLNFDEINRRALETEKIEYKIEELEKVKNTFSKYMEKADKSGIKIKKIDCNNKTVEEIVNEVIIQIK